MIKLLFKFLCKTRKGSFGSMITTFIVVHGLMDWFTCYYMNMCHNDDTKEEHKNCIGVTMMI